MPTRARPRPKQTRAMEILTAAKDRLSRKDERIVGEKGGLSWLNDEFHVSMSTSIRQDADPEDVAAALRVLITPPTTSIDIWRRGHHKVFSMCWGLDGVVEIVSFIRGEWETRFLEESP